MNSPLSTRSLKRVTEGSHWRESRQVLFPMISVRRTARSSAHSCFPGTDKEQSPWEMALKGRQHIGSLKVECPLTSDKYWCPSKVSGTGSNTTESTLRETEQKATWKSAKPWSLQVVSALLWNKTLPWEVKSGGESQPLQEIQDEII